MNTASSDDIAGLVRPSLSHLGIDLVDVQWSGRGRGALLRLIIDRPGGVTLDDCERVSNAAGAVLDAYDLIDTAYRLEVSSPGAERPLRSREDWLQALGRRINVRMRSGEGEAIVEGRLLALSDGSAEVEVRERHRARVVPVTLDDVIAARIAVDI
jgi:ribosome maturation factor RimP